MGTSADLAAPSIRLLGPVEVVPRTALAPRERALLARLAIDTGRTVTVDRLVDDLWREDPPPTARNALQVYVSHLRNRLGRDAIVSRSVGYRLALPAERVDSLDFERLLAVAMGLRAGGRSGEAITALDAAAALWRGAPLADLTDYAFARLEAVRLVELRATCVEHLAEALLATHDLDRLVDELVPLVREFPFRERLRAAAMTGLYRQGRAVDALALYSDLVEQLREELGLEPGPALKALQQAILNDDPALAASLPSGELTLLATSIESPATLEAALGDAYGEVVLAHRDLLRETFRAHSGLMVPTDGERLLAAFPTATDAVRAAAAAHHALAAHSFPQGARVQVRIGVHTGLPRVVEQHYVGTDVHRVLQVAQAASGGQTLLTSPTAHVLAEEPHHSSWHVADLGLHRLPGTSAPEHLHQVSEAAVEFPPPRTLGARSALPRVSVPLVGRDALLAAVVEDVARSGPGITTLLGPGGTGKTRLAIEVADRMGTTSGRWVHFVPLETTRTLPEAWAAVAAACGVATDAPGPAGASAYLAGRRSLLVLDNLEQLDGIATVVEGLLAAGEVHVLATSRRAVGVSGERLHHLGPLDDGEGTEDASRLFALCAALARPGFVLDDDNREAVRRICRHVDGLPLGIELAAARVRQLSPATLAAMLDAGHELVRSDTGRAERQRDLGALTEWSFRLLEPHQQRMFELLSVFVGGVDLETVADLPTSDGADPVAVVLELADASLVRVVEDRPEPRATLLETVRTHTAGRLAATGRADAVRDTHLAAQVALARRLHPRVTGRRRASEVMRLERANVEAALDHALARPTQPERAEAAAEVVACLGDVWHQLGTRAFALTERAAAACPAGSPFHGWMTYWAFRCRWDTETDATLLLTLLTEAEADLRAAGEHEPLAALLAYGGNLGPDVGLGRDWGVDRAQEAVRLAQELDDDWLVGLTATSLVRELVATGRGSASREPLEVARVAAARLGDVDRLDTLTLLEAELLAGAGQPDEAWDLGAPAATGLLSSHSEGTLWTVASVMAGLAAPLRPESAGLLVGIGLGALHRMGSTPGPPDLEHLRDSVRAAEDTLGTARFDQLVELGRSLPDEEAVARALGLLGYRRLT